MNLLSRARRKLGVLVTAILTLPILFVVILKKRSQLIRYRKLRRVFEKQYHSIPKIQSASTTPLWRTFTERLENNLLPQPSWSFLREPVIRESMLMSKLGELRKIQEEFIGSYWGTQILPAIEEDPVGLPPIVSRKYRSSHNSIHHAYHIARFFTSTNADPGKIRSVVEWGGGYGNLAKIWRRMAKRPVSWVIIDIPLFATIQWLYLSAVLGEDHVRLIKKPNEAILSDGITIIPVSLLNSYQPTGDLFVSTWAISESPVELQDLVVERNWFGSKHLLIGFQENNSKLPDAQRVEVFARQSGARIEDIPALSKQYYAFR